jgi:hypothetical protein
MQRDWAQHPGIWRNTVLLRPPDPRVRLFVAIAILSRPDRHPLRRRPHARRGMLHPMQLRALPGSSSACAGSRAVDVAGEVGPGAVGQVRGLVPAVALADGDAWPGFGLDVDRPSDAVPLRMEPLGGRSEEVVGCRQETSSRWARSSPGFAAWPPRRLRHRVLQQRRNRRAGRGRGPDDCGRGARGEPGRKLTVWARSFRGSRRGWPLGSPGSPDAGATKRPPRTPPPPRN